MRIWRSESVRGFSLTLLCLVCVIYPLFAGAGPVHTRGGGDSPFLFVRLQQLVAALRAGAFPVRWMPDAAYGLGYPFYSYYAALPYYVAAALCTLGWGTIQALQATQALGFLLTAGSMALLARRVFRKPAAAALAVVAYTCAPFHLVNVYVRGDSLSEFYAFVFYPLICWALLRLCDAPSARNAAWVALSYGGLILTHNLSALMFTPFVILYALYLLLRSRVRSTPAQSARDGADVRAPGHAARLPGTRRPFPPAWIERLPWRRAAWMLGGGLLGLALSATLWLVVLGEMDQVWMGSKDIQTSGFFHFEGHLRGLDLVQRSPLFDYAVAPGGTPFAMGLFQAIAIGAGVVAWTVRLVRGRARPMSTAWAAGLILSTALITPLSRPLWAHLPVLSLVQFPWRFLSVQAFFGALVVGALVDGVEQSWELVAPVAVLLAAAAVGGLRPEYVAIENRDLTPQRLALFESFTTNIGTTIRGEYLPAAVEPRPYASAVTLNRGQQPAPVALEGELARATLVRRDARGEEWEIEVVTAQAQIAFHTHDYPGWTATIDGAPIAIAPLAGSGRIAASAPQGTHTVALRLGRTPVQWAADLLALSALLAIVVLLAPLPRRLRVRRWRRAVLVAGGGCALLAALWAWGSAKGAVRYADDDLSMDFDRMPLLHHNPDGINWGDRAQLDGYTYPETVHAGSTLEVALRWARPAAATTARVSLVTPATPHHELQPAPSPLASVERAIDANIVAYALPVPEDAAPGPYYLAVRVYAGVEELPALDARRRTLGTIYLRPIWIENHRPVSGQEPLRAPFGDQIALRDDVQVASTGDGWEVHLTWRTMGPIAGNYSYALRVLGVSGVELARRDIEGGPGYGFWPTSAWPAGEWLTDRLRIAAPPGVRPADAAALVVVLYDRAQPGMPALGTTTVPLAEREHRYAAPAIAYPVDAVFGSQIALLGYDVLPVQGAAQSLTLYWRAVGRIETDWTLFVHLYDPATEAIASQWDAQPLHGAYPTSWWRTREVVSDTVTLDLGGVAPGEYRLGIGLYDAATGDRLPAVYASGTPAPGARLLLGAIAWPGPQ
ncbi:MAG: hypothetical protein JXA09_05210 [Anaerolineae bacterium]|nr:hypothetical protein [Anaerolineae bacterium]